MTTTRTLLLLALLATPAAAQDVPALPDPTMTPGAIDAAVTLARICNETTKKRRHVGSAASDAVARAYSVPPDDIGVRYEMDHLIPLALGGSNLPTNLWPQPYPDATKKDALEVEMQRRACVAYRTLVPAEAAEVLAQEQREIAADWVAAYARYMSGR